MENIFDLERYPIADSDHPLTIDLINKTKEELESIGCAVIPSFIKPEFLLKINAEAEKKLEGFTGLQTGTIHISPKMIPNCLKTIRNDFLRNAKAATSLRTTWNLILIFIQFFNPWN